jgi:hypothetical protein
MQSTLSVRRIGEDELKSYVQRSSSNASHATTHSAVALPSFSRPHRVSDKASQHRALRPVSAVQPNVVHPATQTVESPRPRLVPNLVPNLLPTVAPGSKGRRTPLLVSANRALRTVLVALCGVAILGYGLDVAASHEVGKLQDQARRLNEQNSELSASLLKTISYQGIQESSLARHNLHTAEHVVIVKEVTPPKVPAFKATQHHLPVMSGY